MQVGNIFVNFRFGRCIASVRDRGQGTGQCPVSSNIVFDTFEIMFLPIPAAVATV